MLNLTQDYCIHRLWCKWAYARGHRSKSNTQRAEHNYRWVLQWCYYFFVRTCKKNKNKVFVHILPI